MTETQGAQAPVPDKADVVLRFLESVGRRAESEFYVQLFRREPKERFAALSIDANVARHALDVVALHLKFLADLGLAPVVLLGLFEPTDAPEHAARLLRRLARNGVTAAAVAPEDVSALTASCRAGVIPVVAFGAAQGASVVARFDVLGALLGALGTPKLIFLHRPGGLRQREVLVPLVNVSTDLPALLASRELSRKERAIVAQASRLIEGARHKLLVTVTSPLNLLRELFTVKGAGTLLRRGVRVLRAEGYADIDRGRIEALIASSFGRAPVPEFFARPVRRIYLEEQYRGCAIVTDAPWGVYLTKFATDREARGEGIARDLWEVLRDEHPAIFWRARANNPINEWYTKLADGLLKTPGWWVFWVGVPTTSVPEMAAWALAQPVDLPAPAPGASATAP
jgi:acetylglutamate kinase